MNYYYKEDIHYVFYDTLKTDTANIGNGEEIKRTATILSNLAQNFNLFICSTLQLKKDGIMEWQELFLQKLQTSILNQVY